METALAKPKRHKVLRVICFCLILLLLLDVTGRYISIFAVDGLVFWRTTDFYFEKRNTLDAVVLGSSSTYCFWDAPWAWEHYGIAAYPYSTPQQPLASTKYLIEECGSSQPDAVYLINLNLTLLEEMEPAQIHFLSDVMPPSLNRIQMIEGLSKYGDYPSIADRLEFYYPIFAMHERWKLAHLPEKNKSGRNCKGASVDDLFLNKTEDVSGGFHFTDARGELSPTVQGILDDLFAYLDEHQVRAAFFLSPGVATEETMGKLNTICDRVREAGYPCYNGFDSFEEIGLDARYDYCDNSHTNLQGARKFTNWLSEQVIRDFGFADKRGDPDYASWDEAVEHYTWVVRTKQMMA